MRPAGWAELTGLIGLIACGPAGDSSAAGSSSADFTVRDSAGIVVAVTSGSAAHSALGWQVDTLPDLEIGVTGELSGDEPAQRWYTFHRIGGVRQLADGRIVVADGGSRGVRFFSSRGEFLHGVGRRGQGPGEFERGPVLVPSFQSDSLLLFDARPVRFHLLSAEDYGFRFVRPATWKGATPPLGFIPPSVLVGLMYEYEVTTLGVRELPATYAWHDMVSGKRTLLDSFTVRPMYAVEFKGGLAYGGLIPFSSMPSAAVTRSGAFITEGALPEIREYDLAGHLRRIIRLDEPSRPITSADVQSYFDARGTPPYPEIPVPETMPTFQSLLVDAEGWLWAEAYEWDPARRPVWVVFDSGGRAHGSVETPAGLRVHQITGAFLLGVWTDELDVEHVRRYRMNRQSGGR